MQNNGLSTDLLAIMLAVDPANPIRTPENRRFLMEARVGIGPSPKLSSVCLHLNEKVFAKDASGRSRSDLHVSCTIIVYHFSSPNTQIRAMYNVFLPKANEQETCDSHIISASETPSLVAGVWTFVVLCATPF